MVLRVTTATRNVIGAPGTATLTEDSFDWTSMWCFGPDNERLFLRGHSPGLTFTYDHVEGCSCDPKGMPDCKPHVVVHGLRTKTRVMYVLATWPTLVPGDSVVFV